MEGAQALLGWDLVHEEGLRARIVEVEAYRAEGDPGCHAHRGKTPRNAVMFGPSGHAYVYFNYGVHWMLNVTAHAEGFAAAVLIRAAKPVQGQELMGMRRPKARVERDLLSGPGKLAAAFALTGAQNGLDLLSESSALRLEPGALVHRIVSGPRIGLTPGKGDNLPWRFADAESLDWVSRPFPQGHSNRV